SSALRMERSCAADHPLLRGCQAAGTVWVRIGLLSARFPPACSGVGDYTFFLADGLGRLEHEVHVLTSAGDSNDLPGSLSGNVHIHRIIPHWGLESLRSLTGALRRLQLDALV